MEKKIVKKESGDLFDEIKDKVHDVILNYIKKIIETSKNEITREIKIYANRKIKKDIKKYTFMIIGFLLIVIGLFFFLYSLVQIIIYLFELPQFITNLSFAFILIILGMIFYVLNR